MSKNPNIYEALKDDIRAEDEILEAIRSLDKPFEQLDWDDIREDVERQFSEGVLSIDKTTVYTVLLGCGGPTRYYEIECDSEGEPIRGKYVNTAFDGYVETDDKRTEITLDDEQVEAIAQRYMIGKDYQ